MSISRVEVIKGERGLCVSNGYSLPGPLHVRELAPDATAYKMACRFEVYTDKERIIGCCGDYLVEKDGALCVVKGDRFYDLYDEVTPDG